MSGNKIKFGIDLGTTNSCISVIKDGNPVALEIDGKLTVPSCVMWEGGDKFTVGRKAYGLRGKSNVANSFKRLMGTDSVVTLSYKGESIILTPIELSAKVLKYLVDSVKYLYTDVDSAVITVPADFNNKQIKDTIVAGELAGFKSVEVLTEPTSASLVYTRDSSVDGDYLVYDLGGGTFDVSVVNIDRGSDEDDDLSMYGEDSSSSEPTYTVKATSGDTALGGDDLDNVLVDYVIRSNNIKPTVEGKRLLTSFVERLKSMGNTNFAGSIRIPCVGYLDNISEENETGYTKVMIDISEEVFYSATKIIFDKTLVHIKEVMKCSGNINRILTVGGSTKNKALLEFLAEELDCDVDNYLSPDLSVAQGAALKAKGDLVLYDVIPSSIGILSDGIVDYLIKGNSQIPVIETKLFTTVADNQSEVSLDIYQGKSVLPIDCTYLGTLVIDNLPAKPAKTLAIHVSLIVNTNGLLTLSVNIDGRVEKKELVNLKASDKPSGKVTIQDRWLNASKNITDEKDRDLVIDLINQSYTDRSVYPQIISLLSKHKKNRSSETYSKVEFE